MKELLRRDVGVIDVDTAKELGKLHGVEALVIGSITDLGDSIRVIARLIGTETGMVFSSAATSIPKTQTIKDLIRQKIYVRSGVGSSTRSSSLQTSATNATPPSAAEFMSDALRAEVIIAARRKSGGWLHLSIQIENISHESISLFLPREGAGLIDDHGVGYIHKSLKGISWCKSRHNKDCPKEDWTTLSPRATKLVVFSFFSASSSKSKTASFTANFRGYGGGIERDLSIGFPKIPITVATN